MQTNSSTNEDDKSGSDKNESNRIDEKIAMTPDRKPLSKSASLPALDGDSNMPWKTPTEDVKIWDGSSNMHWKTPTEDVEGRNNMPWKTPTEDAEDGPKAIQADSDEALLFPPPNLASVLATPVLSNVQRSSGSIAGRRITGTKSRSDHVESDRHVQKSVSFKNNIQEAPFEAGNHEDDDAYGHFCTSSYEESPKRQQQQQQHQSISLDQTILADNKAFTDTSYIVDNRKEKLKQEPNEKEEGFERLSLPELSISKQRIAFSTRPSHRRFNSNISEISLESDLDSLDDTKPGIQHHDTNSRVVQMNSNRRVSLTVDMETGRSPNRSSKQFYRGQQAMRRVYSSEMLDAQSPRVRRRRAMSHNLDQLRKGLSKRLSLPSPKSFSDMQKLNRDVNKPDIESQEELKRVDESSLSDHSRESIKLADIKRRKRYSVEQVQVHSSQKSRNSSGDVQYRLSAITPIELRRRRYRNSLTGSVLSDENDDSNKSMSIKNGTFSSQGKCNQCLAAVANFLIEVVIFILSKGRENYHVGFVNRFLYWSFRKSSFLVIVAAACSYYVFTLIFATAIYLFGLSSPQCIHVNGVDFDETRTKFMDAFALSWTTFSTVGYGLVHPGTSATNKESTGFFACALINFTSTFEAFLGILFSGFWGAIWFAKVTRMTSFAQVSFSDAIIVKYGTGVTGTVDDEEYEELSSDDDAITAPLKKSYKPSKLPCPIFEFRIANRLHRQRRGEIIDACLNIVASMEESQSTRSIRNGSGMEPMIRRKGRRPKRSSSRKIQSPSGRSLYKYYDDEDEKMKEVNIQQAQQAARSMVASYIDSESKIHAKSRSSTWSKNFPNQIFAKLQVESMEHPFFKRVWNVRHVLDANSPLLKPEAKELMRINNGHWPEELNNAISVRASIRFDQILVSFSGTSNVDANSVYSQNAYKFEDICVGYAFCNMLYRESNDSIGVDHSLLNDVKEQSGGGGEELHSRDQEASTRSLADIFIL